MTATTLCSLLAGFACVAPSLAQDAPLQMGKIAMPAPSDSGFSSRPVVVVWGTNTSDFRGYNTATPASRAANDINFANGPAGSVVGNVHLVGSYFGVVTPAGSTLTTCDVRVSVYSTFAGWIDSTFPGTNLAGQSTFAGYIGNPGFVTFYDPTINIPMALGDVPNTAGTDGLFMIEVLSPGTSTLHPTSWTPATVGTALVIASSDPQRWGDSTGPGGVGPADGLIQAYTTAGAALELNLPTVTGGRAIYGGLWGEVPTPPPVAEDVGCLADRITTRSTTLSPGTVKWYRICLNAPVNDNTLRYLDIDTEGSSGSCRLELFNPIGTSIGFADDDDGSGTNAQLSFGVGRRAPVGDGSQYDGRMGNIDNSTGTFYYLRVENTSPVTPADLTVNFRTNVNTGVNGPSIPPVLNGVAFNNLTPGTNSGVSQPHIGRSINAVRWSQFTLTNCVSTQGGYVDIEFASFSDTIADVVAWIFDSDGNIVAFSDDAGGSNKPQFSFGSASPARPAPAGSTQTFAGQNGDLPYGTYYIATALYDADNSDLSFLPTDHRWHVRAAALSTLNAGTKINYAFNFAQQCPLPTCDSIDFNNDESLFDPIDLDAFLSVYSEGSCVPVGATCNDIDFNNDESVFDPCDINSFLLVFSEGPCTLCGQ